MVRFAITAFVVYAMSSGGVNAFVPASSSSSSSTIESITTTATSTSLHAFTPPTMIIGPMIRKMREEKEKKNMPMATAEESRKEAPGLRVGPSVWKWPPVWPYDEDFFKRKEEIKNPNPMGDMSSMANLISGAATPPVPQVSDNEEEVDEANKFDAIKYWNEEKVNTPTDLDRDAVAMLQSHYTYYLKDAKNVLELGAAEESYIPANLKFDRHVGVGASQIAMDKNPALTESLVADLNDVTKDSSVNSDQLKAYASEPFDAIIMANTLDFITEPRELFKTCWNLLKPGGIFMIPFTGKDTYVDKFERAQTKMWRDMTDDQHMWCAGSFFQFSAGDGWEQIKGFDISPTGAAEMGEDDGPMKLLNKNKDKKPNLYVVQATKAFEDESIDENDPESPEKFFKSKMWMLPTMEDRDKKLVGARLGRAYKIAPTDEARNAILEHVSVLSKIYESLIKMDPFAFTFNMQAQLAVDLVVDPDFNGNDAQIMSLKEGLGLRTPGKDFWLPVGQLTSAMAPEDKINLLAYIVPRFGSNDQEKDEALKSFVSGLKPTFEVIRSKCPDLSEADVQLVGTELLASEILKPGISTREEFASWLGAMSASDIKSILTARKSFKEEAVNELNAYKDEVAAREARIAALKEKMEKQMEKARKERTMTFDPRTGAFKPLSKE